MSGKSKAVNQAVAIIGMSGRFADTENLEQFWESLAAGRDCVVLV